MVRVIKKLQLMGFLKCTLGEWLQEGHLTGLLALAEKKVLFTKEMF